MRRALLKVEDEEESVRVEFLEGAGVIEDLCRDRGKAGGGAVRVSWYVLLRPL